VADGGRRVEPEGGVLFECTVLDSGTPLLGSSKLAPRGRPTRDD